MECLPLWTIGLIVAFGNFMFLKLACLPPKLCFLGQIIVLRCGQTVCLLATLLLVYTLRVLVTSYQLPWQRTRSTKTSTKFQFLLIIWKSNSVTYHFYFFVGKFPRFFKFSDSMEKMYLVELNIFKENAIYGLQENLLDNFLWNFYIWSAIMNGACMQKIKIGHRAKFRARSKIFSAGFISGAHDFTQDLTSTRACG